VNEWRNFATEFWTTHREVSLMLVAISALSFVVGILVTPRLLIRLPSDYFCRPHAPLERLRDAHPSARIALLVLKNALGALLVVAGVLMLVLPGQGLLTLLVGLTLLDFRGKRRLTLWIVRRRPVLAAINWIRERAGHPPLLRPHS
jgi:hypothetical protein